MEDDGYPSASDPTSASGGLTTMDLSPLWRAILEDLEPYPAAVMARGSIVDWCAQSLRWSFTFSSGESRLERIVPVRRLLPEQIAAGGLSHTLEGLG